jgi:site-specific DNA recombinase
MKAVIFARVSSVGQEDGVSLDAQEEKIRNYCGDKRMDILEEFRVVESSTKGERKLFYKALNLIEKGKSKTALVVHSTDRLMRGYKDYGRIEELIEKGKLEIHVVSEGMILNKDTDWAEQMKFDFTIMGAKLYVSQLRGHVKKAIIYKVSKGQVIGNVPIGYLNYRNPETKEASVVLDPKRAFLVKRLFEVYAQGTCSIKELTKMVSEWGLTSTRLINKPLTSATIHNILKNPFYFGYMLYKGERKPHVYPTLIDEPLFEACQQVMEGNRSKPVKATPKPFVFRGLMTCASCGCAVCSDIKKGKYIYLFCTKSKGKELCNAKRIREYKALAVVEKVLNSLVIPPELMEAIRCQLVETHNAGQKDFKAVFKDLQAELKQLEDSKDKLLDIYLKGSITEPEYDRNRTKIEKTIGRIQRQVTENSQNHNEFQNALVVLLKVMSKAGNIFKSSKIEQKRMIINFLFSNLWLDGENITYKLNSPFDKLVNLADDQKWWAILSTIRTHHAVEVINLAKRIPRFEEAPVQAMALI